MSSISYEKVLLPVLDNNQNTKISICRNANVDKLMMNLHALIPVVHKNVRFKVVDLQ